MIDLKESDFSDLASFQLLWRWTRTSNAKLSTHELQKIQPILPKTAKRIYGKLEESVLSRFEMPGQNFFSCGAATLDAAMLDRDTVSNWINARLPRDEERVFVSWISFGKDVAAVVDRKLFIRRWDDFCHPVSDDIDIWAPGLSFVLRYAHDEVFSFKELSLR